QRPVPKLRQSFRKRPLGGVNCVCHPSAGEPRARPFQSCQTGPDEADASNGEEQDEGDQRNLGVRRHGGPPPFSREVTCSEVPRNRERGQVLIGASSGRRWKSARHARESPLPCGEGAEYGLGRICKLGLGGGKTGLSPVR